MQTQISDIYVIVNVKWYNNNEYVNLPNYCYTLMDALRNCKDGETVIPLRQLIAKINSPDSQKLLEFKRGHFVCPDCRQRILKYYGVEKNEKLIL